MIFLITLLFQFPPKPPGTKDYGKKQRFLTCDIDFCFNTTFLCPPCTIVLGLGFSFQPNGLGIRDKSRDALFPRYPRGQLFIVLCAFLYLEVYAFFLLLLFYKSSKVLLRVVFFFCCPLYTAFNLKISINVFSVLKEKRKLGFVDDRERKKIIFIKISCFCCIGVIKF